MNVQTDRGFWDARAVAGSAPFACGVSLGVETDRHVDMTLVGGRFVKLPQTTLGLRIDALPDTARPAPVGKDWTAFYDAPAGAFVACTERLLCIDASLRTAWKGVNAAPVALVLAAAAPSSTPLWAHLTVPMAVTASDHAQDHDRLAAEMLHLLGDAVPVAVAGTPDVASSRLLVADWDGGDAEDDAARTFAMSYDRIESRAHAAPPRITNMADALRRHVRTARSVPPTFVFDEDAE